jgi:hypothetical protein
MDPGHLSMCLTVGFFLACTFEAAFRLWVRLQPNISLSSLIAISTAPAQHPSLESTVRDLSRVRLL